jgi:hypothetical protein
MKEECTDPQEADRIQAAYCSLRTQFKAPIRELQTFMRHPSWLREEISNELICQNPGAKCQSCESPCNGKKCAKCWKSILKLIHGTENHECEKEGLKMG